MYDKADYPNEDQVRQSFSFQIDMTPVPSSGDFRIDINQKELNKLKKQLDIKLEEANIQAEQDLFSRLYTILAKAVLTLRQENKIFRNTLILNIDDICDKVPLMNINNNKVLNDDAEKLLKFTRSIVIKELREDEGYRMVTANRLAKWLEVIETDYIGANNVDEQTNTVTKGDSGKKSSTN